MDNVTHSLAGVLLAEAVCVWRREQRPHVRAAAYVVSALANNLPDIDIVYTWITGPKPLGSLLHHRGHTHTLVVALPLAWLLGVAAWRWFARRHVDASPHDRRLLLGLALLGPVAHLCLDFGNNYGVHPFWPLSGAWFYGDSIFIVEPLWWAIAIPVVVAALNRGWLKIVLWILLSGALMVSWYLSFELPVLRFPILAVAAVSFGVANFTTERARVVFALSGWLAVAAVFALGSTIAKAELRLATEAAFPALQIHDLALTPAPTNPGCWEALVVGEQGGTYRVLRASVGVWPFGAGDCNRGNGVEPTARVTPIDRTDQHRVHFRTEYHTPVAELARFRRDDCRFRALLEFTRVPYVARVARRGRGTSAGVFAGDLRYDRNPGLDFSDIQLPNDPRSGQCPRFVPGWTEPRRELFQP